MMPDNLINTQYACQMVEICKNFERHIAALNNCIAELEAENEQLKAECAGLELMLAEGAEFDPEESE